jgi:hypothetical protein
MMYKHIFPLPKREILNEKYSLKLTPEEYMQLISVYDDFMTSRDLELFERLTRRLGLFRAAEEYAKITLLKAVQRVEYSM